MVVGLEIGVVDGYEGNETAIKNCLFRLKLIVIKFAVFYEFNVRIEQYGVIA